MTVHPAPTGSLPAETPPTAQARLAETQEPSCCRCYLPVLTGFTGGPLLRARSFIAADKAPFRTKPGLGEGFDPTIAGCGRQGTASSPSSTVNTHYNRNLKAIPYVTRGGALPESLERMNRDGSPSVPYRIRSGSPIRPGGRSRPRFPLLREAKGLDRFEL